MPFTALTKASDVPPPRGMTPSANGAAEQAVRYIKRKSQQLLAGTRLSSTWCGVAAKTAAIYSRCATGLLPMPRIPFGTRVMCVRDLVFRDAFAPRALPAVVFGSSEAVPGGYVVYKDGKFGDHTNVIVSSLETHDLTWVKSSMDRWQEPVGVQPHLQPEAWDPGAAPDPSVRRPRPRREPLAEAPAPEEQDVDGQPQRQLDGVELIPVDRPGEEPEDYWLAPMQRLSSRRGFVS